MPILGPVGAFPIGIPIDPNYVWPFHTKVLKGEDAYRNSLNLLRQMWTDIHTLDQFSRSGGDDVQFPISLVHWAKAELSYGAVAEIVHSQRRVGFQDALVIVTFMLEYWIENFPPHDNTRLHQFIEQMLLGQDKARKLGLWVAKDGQANKMKIRIPHA